MLLLTTPAPASPGDDYAALAYLFAFIHGLDAVPRAIERTIQAYDVARRLISEPGPGPAAHSDPQPSSSDSG